MIFVLIIGYHKEYLSPLKGVAIAMGAEYQENWDNKTTHIIADISVAKRQLPTSSKIVVVNERWLLDSYAILKLIPTEPYLWQPVKENPDNVEEIVELNDTTIILAYPFNTKGSITITVQSYKTLEIEKYLDDSIINFYLKYIENELLDDDMREKTYIFDTFFYENYSRDIHIDLPNGTSESTYRYERIKNWTKNVDLFKKEYIVVPINMKSHWFVVIICHPGLCIQSMVKPEERFILFSTIFFNSNPFDTSIGIKTSMIAIASVTHTLNSLKH